MAEMNNEAASPTTEKDQNQETPMEQQIDALTRKNERPCNHIGGPGPLMLTFFTAYDYYDRFMERVPIIGPTRRRFTAFISRLRDRKYYSPEFRRRARAAARQARHDRFARRWQR